MSQLIEVKVPDIGDFDDVPVIELFVKVGDTIKVDDAIATLESDKATMDVPSSAAGVVKEVLVSPRRQGCRRHRADQGRRPPARLQPQPRHRHRLAAAAPAACGRPRGCPPAAAPVAASSR
jgi:hypothetical protein